MTNAATVTPKALTARQTALALYEHANNRKAASWADKAEAFKAGAILSVETMQEAENEIAAAKAALKAAKAKLAKAKRDNKSLNGHRLVAEDKAKEALKLAEAPAQKPAKAAPEGKAKAPAKEAKQSPKEKPAKGAKQASKAVWAKSMAAKPASQVKRETK